MNSQAEWPDAGEEERLLTQLLSNVPTAREAAAVRLLPLVMRFLAQKFPRADPALCDTAAADAVFDFVRRPERFDASRLGLGAYLRMAARRDLMNLLERDRRAWLGIPLISVEEPEDRRNQYPDDEQCWDHPVLAAELAVLGADERVALELMRDGVRQTAAFVDRLGLGHLGPAEQTAAVMRLKDRVKRRLTRALEGSQ